ncbi:MAG: hypothetical protein QOI10_1001 [Solirubrobacterales bacterium]|jgi:hypothetical protein|nr:hypothetical protein [Solirubrobacterales bacterium]
MSVHDSFSSELGTEVEPDEAAALDAVADRLFASRPLPRPALRATIRARYSTEPERPSRPARLWWQVAAYGGAGLALIGVAALGLTGAGPLGY